MTYPAHVPQPGPPLSTGTRQTDVLKVLRLDSLTIILKLQLMGQNQARKNRGGIGGSDKNYCYCHIVAARAMVVCTKPRSQTT